jgi:hypothetical protein
LVVSLHLALRVIVVATTVAAGVVPPVAGAISTDMDYLRAEAARLVREPEEARARGAVARQAALERYSLAAFLQNWDAVLAEATAGAGRLMAVTERSQL